MGLPQKWIVSSGKSHLKGWFKGYPHFRKLSHQFLGCSLSFAHIKVRLGVRLLGRVISIKAPASISVDAWFANQPDPKNVVAGTAWGPPVLSLFTNPSSKYHTLWLLYVFMVMNKLSWLWSPILYPFAITSDQDAANSVVFLRCSSSHTPP